jgi:hypothetical protein
MKDPGPVSVREVSTIETSSSQTTGRKGLIAWLLEALYVSRSREARRVIRRYRHLIADDFSGRPRSVASAAVQAKESTANADRDKTLLRAVDRAIENA